MGESAIEGQEECYARTLDSRLLNLMLAVCREAKLKLTVWDVKETSYLHDYFLVMGINATAMWESTATMIADIATKWLMGAVFTGHSNYVHGYGGMNDSD